MSILKRLVLSIICTFSLMSCSSSFITASGGYSDVALNVNSDEFEITRLYPVKSTSTQIFGVPTDESIGNNTGVVNRFYSFNGTGTKKWMPVVSLASLEFPPVVYLYYGILDADFPFIATGLITGTLAAGINNAMWSPLNRAKQRLNRKLIENNPDVDVFLNPKYEIENRWGFFRSESRVTLTAMGATIKKANQD